MLWSERFVLDHKRQTNRAIHRAGTQLASDPSILEKLHELVACTRKRAKRLFEAPIVEGRHLGVEALVNLSRFQASHIRPGNDWPRHTLLVETCSFLIGASPRLRVCRTGLPCFSVVCRRPGRRQKAQLVRRPLARGELSLARPTDRHDAKDGAYFPGISGSPAGGTCHPESGVARPRSICSLRQGDTNDTIGHRLTRW